MEEGTTSGLDLINFLPDGILQRIGSFLPLEEAVRTSILSSRWRSLWTPSQFNIDIDRATTIRDVVDVFTDKFLRSFDIPVAQNLCFFSHNYSDERPLENKMTVTAIKGADKELHLQFSSQTEKEAEGFELKLDHAPGSATNSAALRTLHVRSVSSVGSSFVSDLFSSCQFLGTLKLEKCKGLKSITIEKNSGLKSLTISDCPNLEVVSVSPSEMVSFSYRGVLPKIELKKVSRLAQVELDLSGGPRLGEFDCEVAISLFASMKEVKKFTISGWFLQWLCSAGVMYGQLEFQFSQLKELTWIDASMDGQKRDSLACFFNICPVLTKLFINIEGSRRRVGCPFFHQHWHEPHLWMDYASMKANVRSLKHLRVVRMSGFVEGYEEEIMQLSLMNLLLEKAAILEDMSITSA